MAISSKFTTFDLTGIAAAGGGFILDTSKFTASELTGIALAAKKGNATIILKGTGKFTAFDLTGIGHAGGGAVIFDD